VDARALLSSDLRRESARKLFHGLSALYALLFSMAGRGPTLWALGTALALAAGLEAARLRIPSLNRRLIEAFGGLHRSKEETRPSGIFWSLAGCFLAALLIPEPDIARTAMLYLAVGDGLAGLAGGKWGHARLGLKSLEGSLACFLGCWVVGSLSLASSSRPEVLAGALAATAWEALAPPPDDNLTLPLAAGLALHFFRTFS
jgi:dolichol kinase